MKSILVRTLVETAETEQRAVSDRKRKARVTPVVPHKWLLAAMAISLTSGMFLLFWHG